MNLRLVLAGVLAAVAMFMWQWVAHDLLPLGMTGVGEIKNEQTVRDTLKANIDHDGMYMFPMAMARGETNVSGPEGMLIYHADVREMSPMMLGSEFVLEIFEMLILAFLISQTNLMGLGPRLGFATLAGIMVAITTNGSYHIWYGFPTDYTAAALLMTTIGYMLGGLVIALMLPRSMKAMG